MRWRLEDVESLDPDRYSRLVAWLKEQQQPEGPD